VAELAADAATPNTTTLADGDVLREPSIADSVVVWLERDGLDARVHGANLGTDEEFLLSAPSDRSDSPSIIQVGDGWWFAWAVLDATSRWDIRYRSYDGTTLGDTLDLDVSATHSDITLSQGPDGLFIGWIADGDAFVEALDSTGVASGMRTLVSTEGNVESGIDTEFDEESGVVVFTVNVGGRREVRSRLIDADGTLLTGERPTSVAPIAGRAPSVTAYGGGFAIAYRAQPTAGLYEMHVVFVHGSTGLVVERYSFPASNWDDGRPSLAATSTGVMGLGWADQEPEGTVIRAVRLTCEDAWLRCARP